MRRRLVWCLQIPVLALVLAPLADSRAPRGPAIQSRSSDREEALTAYYWAQPLTGWSLAELHARIPALEGLAPDTSQSQLRQVLSRVAENVRAFHTNFANTTSLETVEQERLKPNGSRQGRVIREQFRYLILTSSTSDVALKEYRTDLEGRERELENRKAAAFVKTSGFASMPMELSAQRQTEYDFKYLGSESMGGGRQTIVIAFAGHPVEDAIAGQFVLAGKPIPIILQGIAWLDGASFQVARMQTELLAPLEFAGLTRLSTSAVFAEVRFQNSATALWLPQVVDVTADFFGQRYHNRHSYSDYKLFSVATDQKTPASPKGVP
jgi:hypothetical protein